MKTINAILWVIIECGIIYLAFAKDMTLFQWVAWIALALAFIGMFSTEYIEKLASYNWYNFILSFCVYGFIGWTCFAHEAYTFGYSYLLWIICLYSTIINKKYS